MVMLAFVDLEARVPPDHPLRFSGQSAPPCRYCISWPMLLRLFVPLDGVAGDTYHCFHSFSPRSI
jgi:hypothetical protein